jgi:hypothetical protein
VKEQERGFLLETERAERVFTLDSAPATPKP